MNNYQQFIIYNKCSHTFGLAVVDTIPAHTPRSHPSGEDFAPGSDNQDALNRLPGHYERLVSLRESYWRILICVGLYSISWQRATFHFNDTSLAMFRETPDVTEDDKSQDEALDGIYPEGGWRAWLVVLGAWCAMVPSMGMLNTTGVLDAWIGENQLASLPKSQTAWIVSFYAFLLYLGGSCIGGVAFETPCYLVFGTLGLTILTLQGQSLIGTVFGLSSSPGLCSKTHGP